MVVVNRTSVELNHFILKKLLRVRKANKNDLNEIYGIACSVGSSEKISEQGFLVDDYRSNPKLYKKKLLKGIHKLNHFYVAEYDKIYGFMMAYTKEEWLLDNPNWISDVYWRPDFDKNKLENFAVVDKTAVKADLTGQGIGSLIYTRLLSDLKSQGIDNIFAETIISPQPNFASLQFRKKQKYNLAGMRYEDYNNNLYTDLIYHKKVE
ncbi:MAG: GNAT family N-acetyltransferase [Lutispora sp.]|nr:GNAT family N-acetyltransferase [Lutispora sp.]